MKASLQTAEKLTRDVLSPLKQTFVGKDVIIDLMGIALVAGENLFLHGPPGTAKSALVQQLALRLDGRVFDYLLTRFSEPNELFGPFDIRRLRDGDLVTNTEGMLPEAEIVFLDELLNANSAILNSLLMVLNERVFRRGRETRDLPTLMVFGASNSLPQDEALRALFDRFLLRVSCDNVSTELLPDVLRAGWELDAATEKTAPVVSTDEIRRVQEVIHTVELSGTAQVYVDTVHRLRHAGIDVSDRRAVKLQRLIASSAVLCGRMAAQVSDLWVLRYIWDTAEQQSVLKAIVDDVVASAAESEDAAHPQARSEEHVNPEQLARDITQLRERLSDKPLRESEKTFLRDRLSLLAERCQWVTAPEQRSQLDELLHETWKHLEADDDTT